MNKQKGKPCRRPRGLHVSTSTRDVVEQSTTPWSVQKTPTYCSMTRRQRNKLTINSISTVALVDRMCKHLTKSATCCFFVILRAKTKAIFGWCLVDKSRSWFHSSIVISHHSTLLLKWGRSNILHPTSRPRFITIFIPLGKLQRALHVWWTTTYIHLLVTCMLPAAVYLFIQYWQRRK